MAAHAHCSPSSSAIWIACPASATLTKGRERKASRYTREGSAAHAVAEAFALKEAAPASAKIDGEEILIDADMIEHARFYAEYVSMLGFGADFVGVEERVSLVPLFPNGMKEPVFGTADYMAYHKRFLLLHVADFKYGRGHVVSPEWNTQLLIYVLGALARLKGEPVETIVLHVIQPRADGEAIKTWTVSFAAVAEWFENTLKPALERIGNGDVSENPGEHCRWCLRLGECGAMHKRVQSAARTAFGASPPRPTSLTGAELAAVMAEADLISAWISGVRAEAAQRIEHGDTVPGWKLVQKRAVRKWRDPDYAARVLSGKLPPLDLYEPMQIRSPAQVEKALKRDRQDTAVLAELVSRESSGTTLVAEADDRDPVKAETAADVFSAVIL